MRRFIEVAVVVLVIIQNVNSKPQFGQSFASSSITDSSGKVLSKSIYTDSTGKQIVNGIQQLATDLLPPLLPNQIPGLDLPVSPPFNKPIVTPPSIEVEPPLLPADERFIAPVKTTNRPETFTTTTARTTKSYTVPKIAPVQKTAVNNFVQQNYKNNAGNEGSYKTFGNDGSYKNNGKDDGSYKVKGDDGSYRIKGNDGTYKPKGNLGQYVHNNAGAYVHDTRGKYRAI